MVDNFCEVVDTSIRSVDTPAITVEIPPIWSIPPAHTILMAIKITCAWPAIDFPFTLCYAYPKSLALH